MKKRSVFLSICSLLIAVGLWWPQETKAVNVWGDWFDRTVGQQGFNDIGFGRNDPRVIAANVINILLGLLGVLAIILIIYAGFVWMTAAGNQEKIDIAKKILTSASIGLLIVLSAWAITIYILSRLWLATGASGGAGDGAPCSPSGLTMACGCGGQRTCVGGAWSVCEGSDCAGGLGGRQACDANTLTPTCDADNTACGNDSYCHPIDCLCAKRGGSGQSCNKSTDSAVCQADNNLCQTGLLCDALSCVCSSSSTAATVNPIIVSFEPTGGPAGQYVTIRGSGFGAARQESRVYFGDIEADYAFPAVCAQSVWRDNEIVVKVPRGLTDGAQTLSVAVNNTRATAAEPFAADQKAKLAPGLCRLEPLFGQINDEISLWGENFGAADINSQINFYRDVLRKIGPKICWGGVKDGQTCAKNADCDSGQCQGEIAYWGKDKAVQGQAAPEVATTKVPASSVSGPIKIGKGQPSVFSNGLNFTIGQCSQDSQCGGANVCCPPTTPSAGRCQNSLAQCYGSTDACVYEWEFNTGNSNSCPPDKPNVCQDGSCCRSQCVLDAGSGLTTCQDNASCAGYNGSLCLNSLLCPNSPGNCSFNSQTTITGATCSCALLGYANTQYDAATNRCVGQQTCSPKGQVAIGGQNWDRYCADYQGTARWHIGTNQTCPIGYTPTALGSKVCVNLADTCSLCPDKLNCADINGVGQCVSPQTICPNNFTCQNQICTRPAGTCECCCDKTQNQPDKTNPACCAPLTCDNSCGAGGNFGYCSGCAKVGDTQAEHDAACNCTGHAGKYCDTSVPDGACRDCSQIGDAAACSTHDACCVDFKQGNACNGVKDSKFFDKNNIGYCAYYNCQDNCATPSKDGTYDRAAKCQGDCAISCDGNPQTASCEKDANKCPADKPFCNDQCLCQATGVPAEQSCAAPDSGACSLVCDQPYACRGDQGGQGPGQPDADTCLCCCNPFNKSSDPAAPDFDKCKALGLTGKLFCQENVGACTGNARGLCCGCSKDTDCGDAASVGCGADACCHNRPEVSEVIPANNSQEVCRNNLIRVKFNGPMDEGSFSGNIIVVGDYQDGLCPDGSTLLAGLNQPINQTGFLAKWWQKLKDFLSGFWPIKPAAAANDHNFCAFTGHVAGGAVTDVKTKKTYADFLLSAPLSANITYYVIVKGDDGGNNHSGVLSADKVGLRGANQTAVDNFNSLTYPNAYIWQFTTGEDICLLDHVTMNPNQHLFQQPALSYPFAAEARAANDSLIVPLPIYGWQWSWRSDNTAVAAVQAKAAPQAYQATVTAGAQRDDETFVYARAVITDDTVNPIATAGKYKEGRAKIITFFCENPWPAVTDPNAWPIRWSDTGGNCTICTDPVTQKTKPCQPADCLDNHFAFYYCRDQAGAATKDDLPALTVEPPVRGRYKYLSSSLWVDVLKDFYFFRIDLPVRPSGLQAALTAAKQGGEVKAEWPTARDMVYKIYYGTANGDYRDFVDAGANGSAVIKNLRNNQDYYFVLTATNVQKAESEYSDPVKLKIEDKIPPQTPAQVTATVFKTNNSWKIKVNWSKDATEAVTYVLAYGPYQNPAVSLQVGVATSRTVDKLNNLGIQDYYLSLTAKDAYNNASTPVKLLCAKGCSRADGCACVLQ